MASSFRCVTGVREICDNRSVPAVLVMVAPPVARLVAALGCAVEPLVCAPQAIQAPRVGGIGVVDGAVLEHEGAHARPLPRVRRDIGAGHAGALRRPFGCRARGDGALLRRLAVVVVFDAALALLLFAEPDVEV